MSDLFPYQERAIRTLEKRGKSGVIARPGAGKTRIIIEAADDLLGISSDDIRRPILITCSGPGLATWKNEIPLWLDVDPNSLVIVAGDRNQRINLWKKALHEISYSGKLAFICNYSIFLQDYHMIKQIKWAGIFGDEYQRTMRRHSTKTFKAFAALTRHLPVTLMGTGSPIRRHPATMWTLFHLSDPHQFSSYWKFAKTYCMVVEGPGGNQIVGPKNVEGFKELLYEYIAYIPDSEIAHYLPAGHRSAMPVEMSPKQRKVYEELEQEMLSILDSGKLVVASTSLSVTLKLRQLLCCPRLIDSSLDWGGGLEAILQDIEDRDSEVPNSVIFVPFRAACDLVKQFFEEHGYKDVFILRGSISTQVQQEQIQGFVQTSGIMICTIQYSESFELYTSNQAYFLGYCFTVDENEQAEGRLQRVSNENDTVFWRYIQYVGTIDDHYLLQLYDDWEKQRRVLQRPSRVVQRLQELEASQ